MLRAAVTNTMSIIVFIADYCVRPKIDDIFYVMKFPTKKEDITEAQKMKDKLNWARLIHGTKESHMNAKKYIANMLLNAVFCVSRPKLHQNSPDRTLASTSSYMHTAIHTACQTYIAYVNRILCICKLYCIFCCAPTYVTMS